MTKLAYTLTMLLLLAHSTRAQHELSNHLWKPVFIAADESFFLETPKGSKSDLKAIVELQKQLNDSSMQSVLKWNAGSPGYHWQKLISGAWMSDTSYLAAVGNMLLNVALYDAMTVTWKWKVQHKQRYPFQTGKRIKLLVPVSNGYAYPCEHSVAAGVAVTIISRYFPKLKDTAEKIAHEVIQARVAAGVAYAADAVSSFKLGALIAKKEMDSATGLPTTKTWDGVIPAGNQRYTGRFAMFPMAGKNKTVVLDSSSQFRPRPPGDYSSEMAELKAQKNTFASLSNAFYWANSDYWSDELTKRIFEHNYHLDARKATWIRALTSIVVYDGFVACWDAKYTYWGIRPNQLDTTYRPPLLVTPPFPGYPSGHAVVSGAISELMSHFFPDKKAVYERKAKEAALSRFQAGIHFRSDNEVGLEMGKKIGKYVLDKMAQ